MGANTNTTPTLCWDCRNCTKPEVCPWVRNFTPVTGWEATPTVVGKHYPMDSYLVTSCPLFERGSCNAGQEESQLNRKEPIHIDDEDAKNLAAAIIERYVEDWKFLEYGKLDNLYFCGGQLYKRNILRFFASQWFVDLLNLVNPDISSVKVCEALHITKTMLMGVLPIEPKPSR